MVVNEIKAAILAGFVELAQDMSRHDVKKLSYETLNKVEEIRNEETRPQNSREGFRRLDHIS